jgi:CheY-like chemotaxis protein
MRYAHIPIVVLTAMSQDQDKNRAPRLGANAFLTKPFTSAQVVSRVRELLS